MDAGALPLSRGRHRRRRALAALAVLLGAASFAGCATGDPPVDRVATLLSRSPAPAGRHCTVDASPPALPAVATVVDSAALDLALRELWRHATHPPGSALLSLAFDANGFNIRRRLVEHDLPPGVADTVQKLVFAHRRSVRPGPDWGVRLRLELSAERVGMRAGRRERCAARLLSGAEPDALQPLLPEAPGSALSRSAPVTVGATVPVGVLLQLDSNGAVTAARLEGGPIEVARERWLLGLLRSLSFEPALEDGLPVADSIRLRLRLPVR